MRQDTRATLLNSAEDLVRRRGFDGVSFADLADGIGIRKASIHYHFATKGDLSLALIDRYRVVFLDRLAAINANTTSASARLLAFLDLYRIAAEAGRSLCLCVALSVTQQALPAETRNLLAQFHRDVAAWLETVFRLAQSDGTVRAVTDPRAEAQAALAQVEGAQIMARSAADPARFEAAIDTLRNRAL
ncbi:TetR/AcrR family transcriptional regulator [uncultured Tateyamaria sp.]|uniref:TetR/AcrR family transcriptional regulator n=1 Tax=uncultured Tateyamaria sp. TaxID=455651 RepID=UPI00261E3607|nr:TetR/AcrR family transcriptional regulator [uncultured Tateyamaria sp.]